MYVFVKKRIAGTTTIKAAISAIETVYAKPENIPLLLWSVKIVPSIVVITPRSVAVKIGTRAYSTKYALDWPKRLPLLVLGS